MPVPQWRPGAFLVPQYTGENLNLADRITDCDVYRGPIALCRSGTLLQGTFGTGVRLGWVCRGSSVRWERAGIGTLTINWEVGGPFAPSYLLPLDDFREETVELYPKVERNKHMYGAGYPGNPNDKVTNDTIALCYQAVHGATAAAKNQAVTEIGNLAARTSAAPAGSSWAAQAAFAALLLGWLRNGTETYYLAGRKYTYIRHFFTFPLTSNGGVIQTPLYGPRAGDTSLSWLRLADSVEPAGVNGSVYRLMSTWLGGPGGHWDPVLYS